MCDLSLPISLSVQVSHLFDLSFTVAFSVETAEKKSFKGTLAVENVCDDHEGHFEMTLKWSKKPPARSETETELLALIDVKCRGDGTTLGQQVTAAILAVAEEYQALN